MLFHERVLHTAKTLPEGCFGRICHQPANAYRSAALIPRIKYKQNTSIPSRSINRHHIARTLSNNRRTLSLSPWKICVRKCFIKFFNLQNQEDCAHVGSQINLYIDQFLPELAIKQTINIKCVRSPKRELYYCAWEDYLPPCKYHNPSKEIHLNKGILL